MVGCKKIELFYCVNHFFWDLYLRDFLQVWKTIGWSRIKRQNLIIKGLFRMHKTDVQLTFFRFAGSGKNYACFGMMTFLDSGYNLVGRCHDPAENGKYKRVVKNQLDQAEMLRNIRKKVDLFERSNEKESCRVILELWRQVEKLTMRLEMKWKKRWNEHCVGFWAERY